MSYSYSYNFSGLSTYFKEMGVEPPTDNNFSPFSPSASWAAGIVGLSDLPRITYDVGYSSGSARWVVSYHWDSLNIHRTMTGTAKYSGGNLSGSISFDSGEKFAWTFNTSSGKYTYSTSSGGIDYAVVGDIDISNNGVVVGGTFYKNGVPTSDFSITDLYNGQVFFVANSADAHFTLNYARGSFSYGIVNGDDHVFGSFGDDMIFGNGGRDNLGGGSLDDTVVLSGSSIGRVSGGSGIDSLRLLNNIDLSDEILRGFEHLDLASASVNLTLSAESLIWSSVARGRVLDILGDSGDTVNFDNDANNNVSLTTDDVANDGFNNYLVTFAGRSMNIHIDADIHLNFV